MVFFLSSVFQTDPGVPVVYAGFGALMLTTCISYLSHSQVNFLSLYELLGGNSGFTDFFFLSFWVNKKKKIWALQDGTSVVIGGKTNRAKGEFPNEMDRLLDMLPELVDTPPQVTRQRFDSDQRISQLFILFYNLLRDNIANDNGQFEFGI